MVYDMEFAINHKLAGHFKYPDTQQVGGRSLDGRVN